MPDSGVWSVDRKQWPWTTYLCLSSATNTLATASLL